MGKSCLDLAVKNSFQHIQFKWTKSRMLEVLLLLICSILSFSIQANTNLPANTNLKQNINLDDFPFFRLSDEDGLSSNEVKVIIQDRHGYMWFGTNNGISRYDGYQFTNYRHDSQNRYSLSDDKIWALYEDANGIIWIGTELGGLNRFDPDSNRFTSYIHQPNNETSLSHNYVRKIYPAADGMLWIGTSGGGLNLFDPEAGKFKRFKHSAEDPDSLSGDYIRALLPDRKGGLWVGTRYNGLNYLSPEHSSFKHFNHSANGVNQLSSNMVQCLLLVDQDQLLVGTWDSGLNHLDLKSGQWTHYYDSTGTNNNLNDKAVVSIIQAQNKDIWIGTINEGLHRLKRETNRLYAYQNNPSNSKSVPVGGIYALAQDNKGFIWTGTWGGGAAFLNPAAEQFNRYQHQPNNYASLAAGPVEAVVVDHQGTLWVGTEGGGLNSMLRGEKQFTHYKHNHTSFGSIGDDDIEVILHDPVEPDILWLGMRFGGLGQFNISTGKTTHFVNKNNDINSLSSNFVQAIYRDKNNSLWVGTSDGLNRLDLKNGGFTRFQNSSHNTSSLSEGSVYVIFEDSQSNIWVGTSSGGLSRLNRDKLNFTTFKHNNQNPHSISHNTIWDIVEDQNNSLWISTSKGLNKLNHINDKLQNVKFEHYGNDKFVSILIDNNNRFWLSGQKGIYGFDPETGVFDLFDVTDGALGKHSYPAKFMDQKGQAYFGGENGLTTFKPSSLQRQRNQSKVVISELMLYNQTVTHNEKDTILQSRIEDTDLIQIPFDEPVFSIVFSALEFALDRNISYRYKLHNFDSKWTETKINKLTYTNLDSGQYSLEIKASDKNGLWNNPSTIIDIVIATPPWKSWWAYLIYFFSIYITILYVLKFKRNSMALENQRVLNDELIKLDKVKDSFLAHTTHELRTPLNGIIGITESIIEDESNLETKQKLSVVSSCGKRLSGLINDILDYSKIENGLLEIEKKPVNMSLMVSAVFDILSVLSQSKTIKMINGIERDAPLVMGDENRLQQILLNLIGNAIKYTDSGFIKVSYKIANSKMSVTIEDTGLGIRDEDFDFIFEVFGQSKSIDGREVSGTGFGLAITKHLIELHGGEICLESKINIGSKFIFTLPISTSSQFPVISSSVRSNGSDINGKSDHIKILTVDDNPVNLMVLKGILSKHYQLIESNCGEKAINIVNSEKIDLVILDVMMPELSGFETCEIMRGKHFYQDLPILFLTANSCEEDIQQGLKVGGNEFIEKPVSREHLLKLVAKYVDG